MKSFRKEGIEKELNLNKVTIADLTANELNKVRGGSCASLQIDNCPSSLPCDIQDP